MIKEELEKWAEQASDLYNKIGSEKNLSFYTQSPASILVLKVIIKLCSPTKLGLIATAKSKRCRHGIFSKATTIG